MSEQKNKKRTFRSMSYREVQLANSKNRVLLTKPDQQWLKKSGYKNVGWDKVILLYQKIEELIQEQDYLNDLSLGELFLEADRIGNKYLTPEEIADNNQKLAEVNNRINEQIDQAFPDTEDEVIDFGNKAVHKYQTKPRNKKF